MALVAVSCTGSGEPESTQSARGEYAAVYFFDGHALIPEFARMPSADPVDSLMQLLADGSKSDRQNFVVEGSFIDSSEREGQGEEQLVVELGGEFWDRPPGEAYAAAAQIVYTLATLEGGKSILLLHGTVPGEILDGSFESIEQPLERGDFVDVRPWIEVTQPPAGAHIGHEVSVLVRTRGERASIEILKKDRVLTSGVATDGPITLEIDPSEPAGAVTLVITTSSEGIDHVVTVPLRLTP